MTLNIDVTQIKEKLVKELKVVTERDKEIVGFISRDKRIYTVGSDSKIIGRLFEVLAQPVLEKVAQELGMELHESPKQTIYPDFWMNYPETLDKNRIAIDIKTTYRNSANAKFKYTLGSYTGFLRNGTKNIAGDYSMYDHHLVVGFLYTRNLKYDTNIVSIDQIDKINSPVQNIRFFVAEKYKIAGEKPGSGNTANIGTFSSPNIEDFANECGPFSFLGNDVFEKYWRNYPTPSERANGQELYTDLLGFYKWIQKNNPKEYDQLKPKIDKLNNSQLMLQ